MADESGKVGPSIQQELAKKARQEEMIQIIRNKKNELKLDKNLADVEINYYEDSKYEIKGEIINCSMLEIIKTPKEKDKISNPQKIRTYEIYMKNKDNNVLILTIDEHGNINLVENNIEKLDPEHKKNWIKEMQQDKTKEKDSASRENTEGDDKTKKEEDDEKTEDEATQSKQKKQELKKDDRKKIKINTEERKITNREYFRDLVKIDGKYINIYIVQRNK